MTTVILILALLLFLGVLGLGVSVVWTLLVWLAQAVWFLLGVLFSLGGWVLAGLAALLALIFAPWLAAVVVVAAVVVALFRRRGDRPVPNPHLSDLDARLSRLERRARALNTHEARM
jgi:hypothetical protein